MLHVVILGVSNFHETNLSHSVLAIKIWWWEDLGICSLADLVERVNREGKQRG